MSLSSTVETIALHTALISLTLADTCYVHIGNFLEKVNTKLVANADFIVEVSHFHDDLLWFANILELACIWLCCLALLDLASSNNSCRITVLVISPVCDDYVILNFNDCHRNKLALGIKYLCHSNFFADKP